MGVWDVIRKDLKLLIRDWKALLIMVAMPLVLSTILGFALGGLFTSNAQMRLEIAVVKEYDLGEEMAAFEAYLSEHPVYGSLPPQARDGIMGTADAFDAEGVFFDDFLGNEEIAEFLHYRVMEMGEARDLLAQKQIGGIVVLPKGFVRDLYINFLTADTVRGSIAIETNQEMGLTGTICAGLIDSYAKATSSLIALKETALSAGESLGVSPEAMTDFTTMFAGAVVSPDIPVEDVQDRGLQNGLGYYAVGMAAMFILFAAGYGANSLLQEKEAITLSRMVCAGTSTAVILVGKGATVFIAAAGQIGILALFSRLALKAPWGSPGPVALVAAAAAFAVAGLGLVLSVATLRAGTHAYANAFQSVIIQLLAFVGGSYLPLYLLPKFIQHLSNATINGLALNAWMLTMRGYEMARILPYIAGLCAFGLAGFALAWALCRDMRRWAL